MVFFLKCFTFKAVFDSKRNWTKSPGRLHMLTCSTHAHFPTLSASRWAYAGTPSSSKVYSLHAGFAPDVAHSFWFDKCILACTLHYRTTQNSFNALKFFFDLPIHPTFLPNPGNYWLLYCLYNLSYSRMSYSSKCHIVGITQCVAFSDSLLSLSNML